MNYETFLATFFFMDHHFYLSYWKTGYSVLHIWQTVFPKWIKWISHFKQGKWQYSLPRNKCKLASENCNLFFFSFISVHFWWVNLDEYNPHKQNILGSSTPKHIMISWGRHVWVLMVYYTTYLIGHLVKKRSINFIS